MQFCEYQERASKLNHTRGQLEGKGMLYVYYLALGLGEAGEMQGKVKKILRDDAMTLTEEKAWAIAAEAGDILWYVFQIAAHFGIDLKAQNTQDFDELGNFVRTFSNGKSVEKLCDLSLVVGEIVGRTQSLLAGTGGPITHRREDTIALLAKMLAESLLGVALIGNQIDICVTDIARMNLEKLEGRVNRGTLQGSGDNR